jgi:hypothetical protein
VHGFSERGEDYIMRYVMTWTRAVGSVVGLAALGGCVSDDAQRGAAGPELARLGAALIADAECTLVCPVDHPQVSLIGETCVIGDGLADGATPVVITESLELCAGTYVVSDQLLIGDGAAGDAGAGTELGLHAGVTLLGEAGSFVSVQRGSKLVAEGRADLPVVFTSARPEAERAPGDWGGLVLNGRATINVAGGEAAGEGGTGSYGGADDADSSGVLRFVQIEFAGFAVDAENELNGIAFQGVGSGTVVDNVSVSQSGDDGVEFFGGTVNVSNVVLAGNADDSIDWTQGWRGTADTVNVIQVAGVGQHGIEADGNADDPTAQPFSNPTLRNVTLQGAGNAGSFGALLRRGTRATIIDSTISGFPVCLVVDGADSTAAAVNGEMLLQNVTLACDVAANAEDVGAQALLAQPGVAVVAAASVDAGAATTP